MKDESVYRVVYTLTGEWWPRNRKSLGCWLGAGGYWRRMIGKNYRIERAVITGWEDVTAEFQHPEKGLRLCTITPEECRCGWGQGINKGWGKPKYHGLRERVKDDNCQAHQYRH